MKKELPGHCYKCNVLLDPGEKVCGTCQDDTDGRNEHLFQIKHEIPPKSEWGNISLKIGEHLDKTIKKEKN